MAGIRDIATLGFRADARELVNADRSLDSLARTGQRTEQQADRVSTSMTRMARAAASLVAALAVQEYIRLADAWANMNARLSLVTESSQQLLAVQNQLYAMSQRTFSQLGETTDLYTKITRATAELNKTDAERLRLTETINKATIISGTTSATAAAGLQQLGQGLGAGVLRGEEFNSVMENTPRLAEAMAAGLGKTRSEMRLMAEQGMLTTEVVLGALKSQASAIDAEFAKLPTTFGNAMTVLSNSVLRTVGVFDQQNQVTKTLGENIVWVADNMGRLATVAASLAAVGLVAWFGKMAQAATGYVASIGATVAGINANRAATIAAAQADLMAAQAKTTQTLATQAAIVAARQEEIARLAQANRNIAAARTAIAAATAAGSQSFALRTLRQATMALQIAEGARSASTTALAVLGAQQVRISGQITAARTAETIATRALSAAQALATGTATMLSRAMTFLGGPIGIVTGLLTVGAIAWTTYGNKAKEAQDKAAEGQEKTTQEIIDGLNKQKTKLDERLRLSEKSGLGDIAKAGGEDVDRLASLAQKIKDGQQAIAAGLNIDGYDRQNSVAYIEQMKWQYADLEKAVKGVAEANGKLQAQKGAETRASFYDKNTQYLTDEEKVTRALADARKTLGASFTADDENRIRASFGKKATNDALKETERQIDGAKQAAQALRFEREELGLTENQLTMVNAAREAGKAPAGALRNAIMAEALALVMARDASVAATAEKERYTEAVNAQSDARLADSLAAQAAVDAAQREVDTYGMGAAAITRYTIAKMEANKAGIMATGSYSQREIDQLDALIGKQRELMKLQNMRGDLDDLLNTDKVETFGEALRGAFGEAGSALGQLGGQFQTYMEKMTKAEKERAVAKLKYAGDEKRTTRELDKINVQAEKDRIGAYADIAGAAKGMFKEQTAGYKILQAVEQTFRAVELAGQLESLYTHLFVTTAKATGTTAGQAVETAAVIGGETARNVAKVPGVQMAFMSALGPWGMAAAGVAIAAVLGGTFGSSSSVNMADRADAVQKKQGTGSVFGDTDAKADSMAKSLDLLEANSDMVLPLTQNMVASLQSIDASMSGLSNLVVRTAGVTTGENFGIATGVTGKALGGLWGKTKQSITDSGIQFGGSVADLQNGQGYQQYANVEKTKSSFFGLKKSSSNNLTTGALDGDLTAQFALVFKDLEKVLASSAPALGKDADAISAAVRGVQLDMTKLSLMDLKGDELQAAINAVISKASDDVAQVALPGFDAFRKVGEGYAATVMRVATGIERADYELERFGITAIAYSDILNKQGDAGTEIVRQSIMAVAGMGGVADIMRTMSGSATDLAATYGDLLAAQDALRLVGLNADDLGVALVRSAGGLGELQSGLDDYFEGFFTDAEKVAAQTEAMGRKFAALGLDMPDTSAGFRSLVESTPALRGQLLLLSGGFAELMDAAADLGEAVEEIAQAVDTRPMQVELLRAEGKELQAVALSRALELESMDKVLQPMQQRIWMLEDERAALDKSMQDVERAANAERKAKTDANKIVMDGYNEAIERGKKAVASVKTIVDMLAGAASRVGVPAEAQDQTSNRRTAQADLMAMLAIARTGGMLPDADKLSRVLDTLGQDSGDQFGSSREYLADRYQTAIAVADLGEIAGAQMSVEERNLAELERLRTAAERAHTEEMARIDSTLELAQRQLDATNGGNVTLLSLVDAVNALQGRLATSNNASSAAIVGAYGSALGRAPDAAGMEFWQNAANTGTPINKIVEEIRSSTEAQDKLEGLYKNVLGRGSDAAGFKFWSDALKNGVSLDHIESQFRKSDEFMRGFAGGGDHDGGWRKVGENGAEMEYTAPSTIVSHGDMDSMMDNRKVVAAVERLEGEVVNALATIAGYTQRTAASNEDLERIEREKANA
jgi:tape measure domain-containing protein